LIITANYISCLYDVTIAYPNGTVQSELDLVLKGRAPDEVHFHVKRIDISSVPHGDEQINTWLNRYGTRCARSGCSDYGSRKMPY
jgi:lysocardiolipin and lysophospholipid acyltransferase